MDASNRIRVIAVVTAVVFTATCTSTKEVRREKLGTEFGGEFQEVVGFTTVDGVRHEFEGGGQVNGEELVLYPRPDPEFPRALAPLHRPLTQISSVEIRYSDGLKTAGLTVLIILVVLGVIVGVSLATVKITLCPFVHSFDGTQYVFDGEPLAGAVSRSLARSDWSELRHMREVNGQYKLLLTNELDQTQHTDSLALLVVDHRPDERAAIDYGGQTHLFRHVQSPLSARDENGRDILPLVRAVDGVSWTPDLLAAVQRLPLADVRNHVTLEFRRPPGAQRAWLLANVATGTWGATQPRTLLGMRGHGVEEWLRAIDASPELRRRLRKWDEREELFHLGVEVQVGDRWERRAILLGGGPLRSETRAVAVDLSGVEGETVRLRVHPPISFWRFEAFEMAWEEHQGTPRTLLPQVARDERGHDVRSLLAQEDGATLDQPSIGGMAWLEFDAPELERGMARTIFARTHGWYEVHLQGLSAPETTNLARLTAEPGYAVRRALDDLAEFRRTGVASVVRPGPSE
jgi:hypothetical protein